MNRKRLASAAALPLFAALLVTTGPSALASGGGPVHENNGSCSGSTDWKMKAKADDGRIEVELEIDSNVPGQVWAVKITDNGTKVFKGNRTTAGASGSFSVELKVPNQAGTDKFIGKATNAATGETCTAKVNW
jgi:hypothetical protein